LPFFRVVFFGLGPAYYFLFFLEAEDAYKELLQSLYKERKREVMIISKEDKQLIKHMEAIKAYCKKCPGCINCPMFDNCSADNTRRFPRYWYIPEVN